MIDVHGNITRQDYTLRADNSLLSHNYADVNRDGTVNVRDLVLVAANFGKTIARNASPNPDVNRDGIVNVSDLLLVASLLREVPSAPMLHTLTAEDLQQWIYDAKNYDIQVDSSAVKRGIFVLEQLLSTLRLPTETRPLSKLSESV